MWISDNTIVMKDGDTVNTFPIVTFGDDVLKYVFPTKQKAVQKAISIAKADKRIRRLIVFGSAVTVNCGMASDIDLAIEADADEEDFLKIARNFYIGIPSEVDLIQYNRITSDLLRHEIDTKGVELYVKRQ